MAFRFGSRALRVPTWAFAVVGFVLVVGLFFGIRGVASPGGGARGGGGGSGSPDGGTGTGSGTATGGSGSGDSGGATTSGTTDGSSGGSSGGTSDGAWQTGGGDAGGGSGGSGSGGGGSGGGGGGGEAPAWLPWGPKSPNTDEAFEPDSLYDLLQKGECRQAYNSAVDPDKRVDNSATRQAWKVIEGLAGVCEAAQGDPGGMAVAVKAEAGLRAAGYSAGNTGYLCKDGDAFAVLQRFVAYYRRHPGERVALRSAPAGTMACDSMIAATDGSYAPGTTAYFQGTWPDAPDTVELRAPELPDPITLKPFGDENDKARCCKDASISVDLPGPDGFGGRRPTVIDVTLVTKNGARVVKQAAFTVNWSDIGQPPSRSSSPPPVASPASQSSRSSGSAGSPGSPVPASALTR
ncbi:hypothetical protein ACFVYR_30465 [Streptomyces sp. NPDC058284]|uniref:hypothetical protein n=1 Tax=unclassified Streptomyces TaxID=2593676 RepID=UPI0036478B0E